MGRRGYPAEFRRKVLDLLADGKSVASIAHDREISEQTIYSWRRRDRIDRGLQPDLSTAENAELAKANKRIADIETEPAVKPTWQRGTQGGDPPKRRYAAIKVMAADDLPVQVACRVLGVSESGYNEYGKRAPSERSIRHTMLTDESHGIYGGRRIHAERTLAGVSWSGTTRSGS